MVHALLLYTAQAVMMLLFTTGFVNYQNRNWEKAIAIPRTTMARCLVADLGPRAGYRCRIVIFCCERCSGSTKLGIVI
jgi:hypothetical protein